MIEKTILDYLNSLTGSSAKAVMEIPEGGVTPPMWVIQKTGGGTIEGHVGTATLAIQSYGATLYEAAALNQTLKAALDGITELNDVARCELNSDYNFTDTTKKLYRYQAVFDIIHY